jgi:hypothetical protein
MVVVFLKAAAFPAVVAAWAEASADPGAVGNNRQSSTTSQPINTLLKEDSQ